MVSILATGAAGFIGSHVFDTLAAQGHDLIGVDNLRAGQTVFVADSLKKHKNAVLWIMDFVQDKVIEMVSNGEFDIVIHLAAIPRIGYSIENPVVSHSTNVTKTYNLIEACRAANEKSKKTVFLFASSSSIYGEQKQLPMKESAAPDIRSPYAHQKHFIEQHLKLCSSLYGMPTMSFRFFSVFGPRSLGTSSYPTVVGSWLTSIFKREPINIQGTGEQSRDFCHVSNVAGALSSAVNLSMNDISKFDGRVLNLARGEPHSLLDIWNHLRGRYDFKVEFTPARQADVTKTWADVSAARSILGYDPKIDLSAGLNDTIDWYEENWNWIKDL